MKYTLSDCHAYLRKQIPYHERNQTTVAPERQDFSVGAGPDIGSNTVLRHCRRT